MELEEFSAATEETNGDESDTEETEVIEIVEEEEVQVLEEVVRVVESDDDECVNPFQFFFIWSGNVGLSMLDLYFAFICTCSV